MPIEAGADAVEVTRGRLLLEDCDISSRTLSCVAAHGDATEPLIRRCRVHDGADSGLYFFDGTPKPSLTAFRFPFVAERRRL